jgi:DNA mismatch repair protein MSH2
MEESSSLPCVSISVVHKNNQRKIGAAVYIHCQRSVADAENETSLMKFQLYEFLDNDQFSSFDCFLNQIGNAVLYLSDEYSDEKAKGDARKIQNIVLAKDLETVYLKKVCFIKKPETMTSVLKLIGKSTHLSNIIETELPIALGCVESLIFSLKLLETDLATTAFELSRGALDTCMRLDSAAADAVNLLPRPDHPSQFGSLYGVLNRCRTKLGSRLLDRYVPVVARFAGV